MNTSTLPQDLMTNSLLHFQNGVPIDDLALRNDQKRRLARVSHVYWQWVRNPFIDTYQLFRQLVKQANFADAPAETRAAQKDQQLFEFIKESVSLVSRKDAEAKVKAAAEKAIRIGMDTDNVVALTKGGKLLYKVAGLDKPEDKHADMNRISFLPSVVVTNVKEVDPDKEYIDDEETKRIAAKYGAYIPEQRIMVEKQVATMEARAGIGYSADDNDDHNDNEYGDEQDRQ